MIVVEGVDGSGKTNLVSRLCESFDIDWEEKVVDKDTNPIGSISFKGWVENDLRQWPRAAIYDRHRLISEPIYAPIMRGRLADGFDDPMWFSRQLRMFWKAHPVVIYCMPPPDVVAANVAREDTENEAVCKSIATLYWLYHADYCRNLGRMNIMAWDYTQDDYDSHLLHLKYILKEEHTRNASVINQYFRDARETITTPIEDHSERSKRS